MRMKRGAEAWAKSRKVHERIVGKFEGMRRASTGGSTGGGVGVTTGAGRAERERKGRRSLDPPSASAGAKKESRRVSELRREW